jgi:hypothetical protein
MMVGDVYTASKKQWIQADDYTDRSSHLIGSLNRQLQVYWQQHEVDREGETRMELTQKTRRASNDCERLIALPSVCV